MHLPYIEYSLLLRYLLITFLITFNRVITQLIAEILVKYSILGEAIRGKKRGRGISPIKLTFPFIDPPFSTDITLYLGGKELNNFYARFLLRM